MSSLTHGTAADSALDARSDWIAQSPQPERALRFLHDFVERHPELWKLWRGNTELLKQLAWLPAFSHFLSDQILRSPEWLATIPDLHQKSTPSDFAARLGAVNAITAIDLARFRRRELLRIALRDLLYNNALAAITEELSDLADSVLGAALNTAVRELSLIYGTPHGDEGDAYLSVIALGKLGGRELNYSSDIDLMFLYTSDGETSGPNIITNKEFFKKVANRLTLLLSAYTAAGSCYRIDLRLRPEGALGEICMSLAAAKRYYAGRARDWELQMLIKARAVAGDTALGQAFLGAVEPSIYSTSLDFSTIEAMSAARERISEKLGRRRLRDYEIDVKLAPGGVRDIEFLVQCLQRLHGGREAQVRHGGTLLALESLHEKGLLSASEYSLLVDAYSFLRHLEHRLQLEDDQQTHTLSLLPDRLDQIARLMQPHMGKAESKPNRSKSFLRMLRLHLENVTGIYDRIVHAQRPLSYWMEVCEPRESSVLSPTTDQENESASDEDRRAESVLRPTVAELSRLSPYLAEQLTLHPELQQELQAIVEYPNRRWVFESLSAPINDVNGLRRFLRFQLFRIQADSICRAEPIFQTLDLTSALAEFVIARAYRLARDQAHLKESSAGEPLADMMVVALGRLGMREFDLGSDADIVFIIPDSEVVRQQFWTRVAEHLIETLTAHNGGGPVLSIDTRLRPNGREGLLVQTESTYVEYFSKAAEAWEGIAYMKARAVAGDTERATRFLTELQQVDWRRYGQDGRSRQNLGRMRLRLQREQGPIKPLKAGQGGYYDADFILMYLRLKGAGLFFRSLNTPERIDIVEKMGHLERTDAEFLLTASTFFRSLDHAIRLVTGRSEEKLPDTEQERKIIAELMGFWVAEPLTASTLEDRLVALQIQMRGVFEAIFSS